MDLNDKQKEDLYTYLMNQRKQIDSNNEEALKDARSREMTNYLVEGLTQMATAGSVGRGGPGHNAAAFNNMRAGINQDARNQISLNEGAFQKEIEARKMQDAADDRAFNKAQRERAAEIQQREDDPNSEESKIAREAAKSLMPNKDFSGMTATQIRTASPMLETVFKARLAEGKANAAKNPIELEKEKIKLKEEFDVNKEDRKMRKDLEASLSSIDDQISNLESLSRDFEEYSKNSLTGTGPIATMGGFTKNFSKDTEKLDARFKDLNLNTMVKMFAGMSKAVDSDAERRAFEAAQPSITNDDETNRDIIRRKLDALRALKAKTIKAIDNFDNTGSWYPPSGSSREENLNQGSLNNPSWAE